MTDEDTRPRMATDKAINLLQLAAEMGGVGLAGDNSTVVVADPTASVTQQQLVDAVAAHVPDPNYGRPAEDVQLAGVRAKAQQVRDGTATFSAAEVQRILAAVVLRATR